MNNKAQRIILICNELPYPPIHGGRLDIWNLIIALAERDVKICLICWYANNLDLPSESASSVIENTVDELILLPIVKGPRGWLKRLFLLTKYPWFVSATLQNMTSYEALINRLQVFDPDLILLVSIYGADLAGKLARKLRVPLVVRSQNIEHLYLRILASLAKTTRERLQLRLAQIGLEHYESMVLSSCDWYFDISCEDLDYWKSRGLSKGEWLPTFINIKNMPVRADSSQSWDVVYLGNLNLANNVQGVIWFCENVVPKLQQSQPDIRILIAGSKPTAQVESVCLKSNVALLPNPTSASEVYYSARVLINIVKKGSGVNTKSIEMLLVGVPIVTTSQGIRGLPPSIQQYFEIANSAEDFSSKIIDALANDLKNYRIMPPFNILNQFFGDEAVNRFESRLSNVIAEYNQ